MTAFSLTDRPNYLNIQKVYILSYYYIPAIHHSFKGPNEIGPARV